MIHVTVEHTSDLGPEAEMPALVLKLAEALAGGAPGALACAAARPMVDYALTQRDWALVTMRVRAGEAQISALAGGLFDRLCDIAEAHFAELYTRRSIALTFALDAAGRAALVERVHARPASAETF